MAEDENDEHFIYRLNDNGSGPSLLVKVCAERGWRMYQGYNGGEDRWNLWWRTSAFPAACYKALGDWQFMNHIPKGGSICRKDSLSRLLRCMRRIYGSIYDFSPPCFHLPLEYAKLVSECSRLRRAEDGSGNNVVWIHKPVAQSQGRGIFLFRYVLLLVDMDARVYDRIRFLCQSSGSEPEGVLEADVRLEGQNAFTMWGARLARFADIQSLDATKVYRFTQSVCEMRCGSAAVVQRYIERPLLVAGYKFDLRLYVCVPGYRPLTAYMYAEGLARFGTDKYTLSDIHNPYRHLTNSSLNKTGPRYSECKDRIGSGCKWTLKQVRRALVGRWGAVEWLVWQRIRALVTLTLLAQAAGTPPARNCFEFYGFDVLLDESMKPWLLEVNLSPALAADCEADVLVKQPMLHELFDLLGLPMRHTGLSLLQGPPTPLVNSSEDEGGVGRIVPQRIVTAGTRRGTRWRRRRAMPIHCVTLQPPIADKYPDFNDKNIQMGRLFKPTSETSLETSESQSSSGVAITGADCVDESWRGGYATAASRRRMLNASTWGNGVRWHRAPARLGHWVRIYPHTLPDNEQQFSMEDARESVAHVSKFIRAAREVVKESGRDIQAPRDSGRDSAFEALLRKKLGYGSHFEVWLPPF